MALTLEETNKILEDLKKVKWGSLTPEQKALIEKIQPLLDSQAADQVVFTNLWAKIAELEDTDTNVETVLNTFRDILPPPVPETPPNE